MLESFFWAVLLRSGQIAIEASTTFLCGLFVAAVMRRMMGAEGTRKLFGGKGVGGLLRALGIGMLLPVCSLGVIPIAREMRRAGVPSGTVLSFILAAPQINPLSLLYGLTLSEPIVILWYAIACLVIAFSAGAIWDRYLADERDTPTLGDEPMPAPGLKRLAAVAVSAGRDMISPSSWYVLLGILFTGLMASLIPFGSLSTTMRHDDWTSPAFMTLLGTPFYSGPLQGTMRIGLMFEHGNSVGASFALFELGVGMSFGLMVWMAVIFGVRRVAIWFALVMVATMVMGYVFESRLYYAKEEASHTHAFDDWTNPFPEGMGGNWETTRAKLLQKIEVLEPVAILGLMFFGLLGGCLAVFDRTQRVEQWLIHIAEVKRPKSKWDVDVPGPVLGIVSLLGLILLSVVALFIYYPPPKEALDEITRVSTDALVAVSTGKKEEGIRQLQQWDLLTRKLQVGVFLRTGKLDPESAKKTEDLRELLEEVRDHLLAGEVAEAKGMLSKVKIAYREFREMYRNE